MRRIVVALALLAVAVGGFLVFRTGQRREAREARRDATLLSFDERAVTAVELTLRGDRQRFERREDGWWLTDPVVDRADSARVSELLGLTRKSPVLLRIEDPEPPAAYGLSPATLVIRMEGVDVPALRLGSVSPDGSGLYGAVEGRDEVLVIQVSAGSLLTRPSIEEFRETSLPGLARSAVESVALSGGGHPEVDLRRDEDGWWIERPVRRPASDAAVTTLLDRLDKGRILRFVDGADRDDPGFGLGPEARIVALGAASDRRTVRLGSVDADGLVYAARDDRPAVLVVADVDVAAMPADLDDLGDTRLTKVNRYKVRRFEYRRGDRTIVLTRDGETWSADGREVPADRVLAFLARVLEAPVRSWRQGAASAAGPEVEARWTLEDGSEASVRAWSNGDAALDAVPGAIATAATALPEIPAL